MLEHKDTPATDEQKPSAEETTQPVNESPQSAPQDSNAEEQPQKEAEPTEQKQEEPAEAPEPEQKPQEQDDDIAAILANAEALKKAREQAVGQLDDEPKPAEEPATEQEEPTASIETKAESATGKAETTEESAPSEPEQAESATAEKDEGDADSEEDDQDDSPQEEEDFSRFNTVKELFEAAEALVNDEGWASNIKRVDRALGRIREEVERIFGEEREAARRQFLLDNDGSEEGFHYPKPAELEAFYKLYSDFRSKKRRHYESMQKEREDNLKAKEGIIDAIKKLIDEAMKKGSLEQVKEYQKQWKQIGPVPQINADELYRTYSAVLDQFYDKKSIEYELKELDRKKNLEAKRELCDRAEALLEIENINEAVRQLNKLHEEFKSVGPVPQAERETVWERFKSASDKLYDRKREYAETFKQELQANMEKKQELCLKVEEFVSFESDRIKAWNAKTKELLELQKQWEAIGALPREIAKDINKQFWTNFKGFFANKSAFFDSLEAERKDNLAKKEALCEKVEEVQDSKDYDQTANLIKQLQRDWKEIGPVPEAQRESIYQRFKAACDHFFNRKRNRRNEQEQEFKDNFKAKKEVIGKIKALAKEKSADLDALKAHCEEFTAIGFVPRNKVNDILDELLIAVDEFFEAAEGMSEGDRENKKIDLIVSTFKGIPNAFARLQKQEQGIRKKIQNLENDIALWENNLQFFAKSKTADKLREEFSGKIEDARKKIGVLKNQLKVLRQID